MGYALDLLNKDYEIQKPLSNELYNPILLGVAGFASIAFSNYIMRRPLMSGIQRHVALGTAGVFFGIWVNKKRDEHYAERDAVLRHYVGSYTISKSGFINVSDSLMIKKGHFKNLDRR